MTKTTFAVYTSILVFAGCSHTPVSPSTLQSLRIEDLVSSVSVSSSQGALTEGQAPASGAGPVITVGGNQAFVNGGTLPVSITSVSQFDTIYLVVGAKIVGLTTESSGGIDGYYVIHLPSSQTSATAVLAFPQTTPLPELDLQFAVSNSSGPLGPFVGLTATAIQVGTGDIQVTLSWDADSDVDLHVVEPSGEEVYYGHLQSTTGGQLDLDSNAACSLDHKRNENVTWPVGLAPRGTYIVRVDYWSSCQVAQTNYVVRINNGGAAQIFTGSFTGPGDGGGRGDGRLIASFERLTGPTATSASGLFDVNTFANGSLKIKAPWAPVKP